jgi:hypothetical protein
MLNIPYHSRPLYITKLSPDGGIIELVEKRQIFSNVIHYGIYCPHCVNPIMVGTSAESISGDFIRVGAVFCGNGKCENYGFMIDVEKENIFIKGNSPVAAYVLRGARKPLND